MPRSAPLRPEAIADIVQRRRDGETLASIADRHGVSTATVIYHCRTAGLVAPQVRAGWSKLRTKIAQQRAGEHTPARSFSVAEVGRLHSLGRRHTEIAALLRIPHRDVAEALELWQSRQPQA